MNAKMKVVQLWAANRGLNSPYESAIYFDYEGYDLSVGYSLSLQKYTISVPVDAISAPKDAIKRMNKALKKTGIINYFAAQGAIRYALKASNKKKMSDTLDAAIVAFTDALKQENIISKKTCIYCGQANPDTGSEQPDAIIMPAHAACKHQEVAKLMSEIDENKYNGNYLLGTIGAILGALVGAIPIFVSLLFFDTFFSILYALIPMGAVLGYKLFRGIANGYMRLVAIVLAIVVGAFSYVVAMYFSIHMYDYKALSAAQKISDGKTVSSSTKEKITDLDDFVLLYPFIIEEMKEAGIGDRITPITFLKFVSEFGDEIYFTFDEYMDTFKGGDLWYYHGDNLKYVIGFTGLGILFAWSYISQTNKRREDEIKKLMGQDYVPANNVDMAQDVTTNVPPNIPPIDAPPVNVQPSEAPAVPIDDVVDDVFSKLEKDVPEESTPIYDELFADLDE